MRSLLLPLNAAVLLAGCATGPLDATGTFLPPIHNERLAQAKICCSTYREMPFAGLALGQETSGTLTAESPVYAFGEGRSFFAAFELPASAKRLEVKTYPVNMLSNPVGHVLVPAVQFLSTDYQLVETAKPLFVERRPPFIGRSWAEAQIPVPASARYFVLLDGKSTPMLRWPDPPKPFLYVRSGPTGEFTVRVYGG